MRRKRGKDGSWDGENEDFIVVRDEAHDVRYAPGRKLENAVIATSGGVHARKEELGDFTEPGCSF
jgi:hypothetical protein